MQCDHRDGSSVDVGVLLHKHTILAIALVYHLSLYHIVVCGKTGMAGAVAERVVVILLTGDVPPTTCNMFY